MTREEKVQFILDNYKDRTTKWIAQQIGEKMSFCHAIASKHRVSKR